jgi:serpin B
MKTLLLLLAATAAAVLRGEDVAAGPAAINALGVDLLRGAGSETQNFLISPYSIHSALAMTSAGADGVTLEEMRKVLHFSGPEEGLHLSMEALGTQLAGITARSSERAELIRGAGKAGSSPTRIRVANRLFGQEGFYFRPEFLGVVSQRYGAPLERIDFRKAPGAARENINRWVEQQTESKICNLLGADHVTEETRLILVNALYFMAAWQEPFSAGATQPEKFLVRGTVPEEVPTMRLSRELGYQKGSGWEAVTLPYENGELQFVVLLPQAELPALESRLTPELLSGTARLPLRRVQLHLPKFRIEGATLPLSAALKRLGMRAAFDEPRGSADFGRMAERRPSDYLYVGEVLHKTFMELDEKGTEAAAATAVVMMRATSAPSGPEEPLEVKVDRPFLFAVQHVRSGACLFLGRMTDPRPAPASATR